MIFLIPMIFLIFYWIFPTPKLSKYIKLKPFTYKATQWVPIDLYSSRFITLFITLYKLYRNQSTELCCKSVEWFLWGADFYWRVFSNKPYIFLDWNFPVSYILNFNCQFLRLNVSECFVTHRIANYFCLVPSLILGKLFLA